MITIEKIRFKNFRSYSNRWAEYSVDNNLTIIQGKNGSGKTTILYAIMYALYGKIGKLKQSDIVNNINSENLLVEIEFKKGEDRYLVKRGISPNIFEIYKNNIMIPIPSSLKDYQKILEDHIIGISFKLFNRLIMVNSTIFEKNFITLPASERRDFLEEVLSLDMLTHLLKYFKDREKIDNNLLKDCEYNISKLEQKRIYSEDMIKQYSDIISNSKIEIEQYHMMKSYVKKFKKHNIKKMEEQNKRYLDTKSKIDMLRDSVKDKSLNSLIKERDRLSKELNSIKRDITTLESSSKIYRDKKDDIDFYLKEIERVGDISNIIKRKEEIESSIKKSEGYIELKSVVGELNRLITLMKSIDVENDDIEDKLSKLRQNIKWYNNNRDEYNNLVNDIKMIEKTLYKLEINREQLNRERDQYGKFDICKGCDKLPRVVDTNYLNIIDRKLIDIDSKFKELKRDISIKKERYSKYKERYDRERDIIKKEIEYSKKYDNMKNREKIEKKIDSIKKRYKIDDIDRLIQDIEKSLKSSELLQAQLKEIDETIKLYNRLKDIERDITRYNSTNDRYDDIKDYIISLKESNDRLEKEIVLFKDIKNKIDNIGGMISQYDELNKLLKDIKKLKYVDTTKYIEENSRYDNMIKEIERFEKDIKLNSKLQSDIDKLRNELKDISTKLKKLEKEKNELENRIVGYKNIEEVITKRGIKERLFSQYIPIFNRYVNQYTDRFDMNVNIELDGNFNFKFRRGNRELSWHSFSMGESIRLNLSILLSFIKIIETRNRFKMNILAFDEIDGVMDRDVFNRVLELLSDLNEKNIIFITHRNDFELDRDYRLIEIKKDRRFSKIVSR